MKPLGIIPKIPHPPALEEDFGDPAQMEPFT